MKLVIPFVGNWTDFGGMDQYVRWLGGQFHDQFYNRGRPSAVTPITVTVKGPVLPIESFETGTDGWAFGSFQTNAGTVVQTSAFATETVRRASKWTPRPGAGCGQVRPHPDRKSVV